MVNFFLHPQPLPADHIRHIFAIQAAGAFRGGLDIVELDGGARLYINSAVVTGGALRQVEIMTVARLLFEKFPAAIEIVGNHVSGVHTMEKPTLMRLPRERLLPLPPVDPDVFIFA